MDPAIFELEPNTKDGSWNIPNAVDLAVVKAALGMPATGADTFF